MIRNKRKQESKILWLIHDLHLERQTELCRMCRHWDNRAKAFSIIHLFILAAKYLNRVTAEEWKQLGSGQEHVQRYLKTWSTCNWNLLEILIAHLARMVPFQGALWLWECKASCGPTVLTNLGHAHYRFPENCKKCSVHAIRKKNRKHLFRLSVNTWMLHWSFMTKLITSLSLLLFLLTQYM